MSLECKQILSCMEMSSTTLLPTSSMFAQCEYLDISILMTCTDLDVDSIGYMVMLYPSCVLISHIGPSRWLPTCEVSHA